MEARTLIVDARLGDRTLWKDGPKPEVLVPGASDGGQSSGSRRARVYLSRETNRIQHVGLCRLPERAQDLRERCGKTSLPAPHKLRHVTPTGRRCDIRSLSEAPRALAWGAG